MVISGTITQAGPASAPAGQYQVRYQDIAITDQHGGVWTGRIGSKQGYQPNTPISVTVEEKQGDNGPYNYFRKYNPQYPDQQNAPPPPQTPQGPQRPAGRPNAPSGTITPDMIKARSMGLAYAKDLVVAGVHGLESMEALFPLAEQCTAFITTGQKPQAWSPDDLPEGAPPARDDETPWDA